MTLPYISVVVATYRRKEPLEAALHSLAEQTYTEFEIILVDDNGDASWNGKVSDLVQKFRLDYPQIAITLIVNQQNLGSARTRNVGIAAARGDYVTFLDDDDIYLPQKIEKQYKSMSEASADYGITDLFLYNESGKLIDKRIRHYIVDSAPAALMTYHFKYHMTGTDTIMFRRDYLHAIGCFDGIDVGDEFYLMQKAIAGKGKFNYLHACDVKAYVHTGENSLSSGQSKIDGENQLYTFKKQFFSEIDAKSRRYIRMRHYAVLAFAGLRMKRVFFTIKNGMASLASAPIQCVMLCMERKK